MNEDRFIYLLAKKRSGELTLEEQLELSSLMKSEGNHPLIAEGFDEIFASSLSYKKEIDAAAVNDALKLLHRKIEQQEGTAVPINGYKRRRLWLAAASVVLAVGLAAFYFLQWKAAPQQASNTVSTKKGSKTNLELPDGTKVWVNADTKLTYDKEFGNNTREVTLTGEAYFDVTKDPSRPFIVHTRTLDVKVLGTAFNVRAYANEINTQTTLLRGAVEILLKNKKKNKIVLSPNEKITIRNTASVNNGEKQVKTPPEIELVKIHTNKSDSLSAEIQWIRNRLVFEDEKFENIIPMLERWYNVTIELRKNINSGRLYNGTFENDSLKDVLESLKTIVGFNYTIEKDKVVIF